MLLEDVHVLEQRVVLEHEPDVAALNGDVVDAVAANEDVAAGGRLQAGDHAQDGRFAPAAGAEQGHQLALFDGEGDAPDGGNIAESLGDVSSAQCSRGWEL